MELKELEEIKYKLEYEDKLYKDYLLRYGFGIHTLYMGTRQQLHFRTYLMLKEHRLFAYITCCFIVSFAIILGLFYNVYLILFMIMVIENFSGYNYAEKFSVFILSLILLYFTLGLVFIVVPKTIKVLSNILKEVE